MSRKEIPSDVKRGLERERSLSPEARGKRGVSGGKDGVRSKGEGAAESTWRVSEKRVQRRKWEPAPSVSSTISYLPEKNASKSLASKEEEEPDGL